MHQGYLVPNGYMGYVRSMHKYILFASESEYLEYLEEDDG